MSNRKIVEDFIAAWNRNDTPAALSYLTDDIFYHNVPLAPLRGIEAVRAFFDNVGTISETNWQTINIAENGNVVLTERLDDFKLNGRDVSLPVMGAFVIRDGKIAEWRDYFDGPTFQNQIGE